MTPNWNLICGRNIGRWKGARSEKSFARPSGIFWKKGFLVPPETFPASHFEDRRSHWSSCCHDQKIKKDISWRHRKQDLLQWKDLITFFELFFNRSDSEQFFWKFIDNNFDRPRFDRKGISRFSIKTCRSNCPSWKITDCRSKSWSRFNFVKFHSFVELEPCYILLYRRYSLRWTVAFDDSTSECFPAIQLASTSTHKSCNTNLTRKLELWAVLWFNIRFLKFTSIGVIAYPF